MAKRGTINWKGASGKTYEFEVWDYDTTWNSVACNYVVSRRVKNPDNNWTHTALYAGESDDLKDRFSAHHKAKCFQEHAANILCVRQETNGDTRLLIETDLINSLNPVCND